MIEYLILEAREYTENGLTIEADAGYREVLAQTDPPTSGVGRVARGEACVHFAKKALKQNRLGEAGDWYRDALDADPRAGDYRADFVTKVLQPIGMQKAALAEAKRAVQVDPENARCWHALGAVLHEMGDGEYALAAHEKALQLAPNDPVAHFNLAALCLDLPDYDRVRKLAGTIMARFREHGGNAANLLAMVAYREGHHEDAIYLYDRAIRLGCADPSMARWNKALPLHSLGRYREGWALYEERGRQTSDPIWRTSMTRFARPMWAGEPPPARIHMHAEMGYGDSLALARYAPLLAERGYDVRMEVNPSLVELFRHSFPNVKVIEKALDYPRAMGIEDFDFHLPMLSAPAVLKTEVDTVPWSGPYLKVSHGQRDPKRRRLRVGLCWSSGIRDGLWLAEYGRRKSMAFTQLAPLFSHDIEFYSLQCGPAAHENSILPGLGAEEADWSETAELIASLDLVITVDSAVAHLAGAMGKPVWVMMHTEGSWHWMTAKAWDGRCATESPWYPSARLFRQEKPHEWNGVIEAINEALGRLSCP